jgi:aminoglycoside phosphotransferase (APT) family kinase protein
MKSLNNSINTGDLQKVGQDELESVLMLLNHANFCGKDLQIKRISGGVSSNVWLASSSKFGAIVVKQPLPELRVHQVWRAPLERINFEYQWFRTVRNIMPTSVPEVLYFDEKVPVLITRYLPSTSFPVWQRLLFSGVVDQVSAKQVGSIMAAVHAITSEKSKFMDQFNSAYILTATRIEPYFFAVGCRYPILAEYLQHLGQSILKNAKVVIHGDVSPKNILIGADGPIFLDAECACFADPAFDLAFCLNHLLLKQLVRPNLCTQLLSLAETVVAEYILGIQWEPSGDLIIRTALLLPALMLARVDGKVPVSYLDKEWQCETVRLFAIKHLLLQTTDIKILFTDFHDTIKKASVIL